MEQVWSVDPEGAWGISVTHLDATLWDNQTILSLHISGTVRRLYLFSIAPAPPAGPLCFLWQCAGLVTITSDVIGNFDSQPE